jgi:hypothetical protein
MWIKYAVNPEDGPLREGWCEDRGCGLPEGAEPYLEMERIFVNFGFRVQCYGGPEEGGWYYDRYTRIFAVEVEDPWLAEELVETLNTMPPRDPHECTSVLNTDGEWIAFLDDHDVPSDQGRPRYE